MWLIDFNNVAIEKIQPKSEPSCCLAASWPFTMCVCVCVCVGLALYYNNLFLYLFGKLRRNGPMWAHWATENRSKTSKGRRLAHLLQQAHTQRSTYTERQSLQKSYYIFKCFNWILKPSTSELFFSNFLNIFFNIWNIIYEWIII